MRGGFRSHSLLPGSAAPHKHHFSDTVWRPLLKSPLIRTSVVFFGCVLLLGAFLYTHLLDSISAPQPVSRNGDGSPATPSGARKVEIPRKPRRKIEIPLNCSAVEGNETRRTCPGSYYPQNYRADPDDQQWEDEEDRPSCPHHFRWIHEDLRPWKETGITREMVERAQRTANFRLVVVGGRAYVEKYEREFQTRDVVTLWAVLQLLRRYPGKVPDLELMFDCMDRPRVMKSDYPGGGPNATAPPPLFRYCGDDHSLDIVFPDWSFWGWPEINIKPWEPILKEIKEGNNKTKWMEREPYAYWKGNPHVAPTREDLLKCNVSAQQDWNARIYEQNWVKEFQEGYKQSNLANQCTHRYKIYIEGYGWSVSEKYILACDSVTLYVRPHFYDFFSRSLMPVHHYWPVREDNKCPSLMFAVQWGNSHKQKAQAIGKAASDFIFEDLKMDFIYDYMFHLLTEYAKLQRFKPSVNPNTVEFCAETMLCDGKGREKEYRMETLVKGPAVASPCKMPPPFEPRELVMLKRRKENSRKQVEAWETTYWDSKKNS